MVDQDPEVSGRSSETLPHRSGRKNPHMAVHGRENTAEDARVETRVLNVVYENPSVHVCLCETDIRLPQHSIPCLLPLVAEARATVFITFYWPRQA